MEKEIDRFRKKAACYRQALKKEPHARLLELYPIIGYLEKYTKSTGKRKKSIRIVDLMAGSGFLSDNLYKLGYTNIHAIEFCKEMCQDSPTFYSKAQLHYITSFDYLEGLLEEIKPDVIISLASFHHLIVYDENGNVDRMKSINFQVNIIDKCMRTLSDYGIFLIVDLIDTNVLNPSRYPIKFSMKSVACSLHKLGLNNKLVNVISNCSTLHAVSSKLQGEFGNSINGRTLRWFRNVVDKMTSVGHKDIAISQDLIQQVINYHPIVIKYVCPWVFNNINRLLDFVYKKFGFSITNSASSNINYDTLQKLIKKELGIKESSDYTLLGWSLGIVLLSMREPFVHEKRYQAYAWYLSIMVIVLIVAIIMRLTSDIYVELNLQDIFLFLLTLPVGAIFGEWIASRKD